MIVYIFVVFLLILIGVAIYVQGVYMKLLHSQESLEKTFSEIKSLEKQRFDEIPNLIKLCGNHIEEESEILDKIAKARQYFLESTTSARTALAGSKLTKAIDELEDVSENHTELKENSTFVRLLERLNGLEKQVAEHADLFNNTVSNFNTRIQQSPDKYIARIMKYNEREIYQTPGMEDDLEASEVGFGRSA